MPLSPPLVGPASPAGRQRGRSPTKKTKRRSSLTSIERKQRKQQEQIHLSLSANRRRKSKTSKSVNGSSSKHHRSRSATRSLPGPPPLTSLNKSKQFNNSMNSSRNSRFNNSMNSSKNSRFNNSINLHDSGSSIGNGSFNGSLNFRQSLVEMIPIRFGAPKPLNDEDSDTPKVIPQPKLPKNTLSEKCTGEAGVVTPNLVATTSSVSTGSAKNSLMSPKPKKRSSIGSASVPTTPGGTPKRRVSAEAVQRSQRIQQRERQEYADTVLSQASPMGLIGNGSRSSLSYHHIGNGSRGSLSYHHSDNFEDPIPASPTRSRNQQMIVVYNGDDEDETLISDGEDVDFEIPMTISFREEKQLQEERNSQQNQANLSPPAGRRRSPSASGGRHAKFKNQATSGRKKRMPHLFNSNKRASRHPRSNSKLKGNKKGGRRATKPKGLSVESKASSVTTSITREEGIFGGQQHVEELDEQGYPIVIEQSPEQLSPSPKDNKKKKIKYGAGGGSPRRSSSLPSPHQARHDRNKKVMSRIKQFLNLK